MKHFFLLLFLLFGIAFSSAAFENKKVIISGHIRDAKNGEDLLGASVYIKETASGSVSNLYGFYSVSVLPGKYTIIYSYVGYESLTKTVEVKSNMVMDVELNSKQLLIKEVVVQGKLDNDNVVKNEMSTVKMDVQSIRKMPALLGEVDVIKAIQLLPGVQASSEGATGFSVRGGGIDQNLIMLDEATVYNASHLMGFFSVFNNDAIKDVILYKGDIPASSGGRLSSLLDVRMKDGNMKRFDATGGIGLISSRLTVEGPIAKDKASFIVSGRRTYADIFLGLSNNVMLKGNALYFWDLNTKCNWIVDPNNRLYLSAYMGKDVFKSKMFGLGWGNSTVTLRWNHLFSQKLFANFTGIYSNFNYNVGIPSGQPGAFDWLSSLTDYGFKGDFTYFLNTNNTVRFGVSAIYHSFMPGVAKGLGSESFINNFVVPNNYAWEDGAYISNEQKVNARLSLKYGLRFSLFQNVGRGTIYNYDSNHIKIDSTVYPYADIFNYYYGLEPRLGVNYQLTETSSLKASYTRSRQYIQLASNSTSGAPLDVWFPASPNVKPQISDQYAMGYFRNFYKNHLETSIELYYKNMQHTIDFKDHAVLLLNKELEGELRYGKSWAYGAEFYVKLQLDKWNGWVSYTLSRSERQIDGINQNKVYLSPHDKLHNLSVVLSYDISKRLNVGANWVFATGSPVTFPTGKYVYGNTVVPVYSDRNSYRMPDYHRLDLSLTLKGKDKPGRRWHTEWNFSVYNAYARKNAWVINFKQDENDPSVTIAEETYLFTIIPSVTFNFNF